MGHRTLESRGQGMEESAQKEAKEEDWDREQRWTI